MDGSPVLGHRFHPERSLLLWVLALLVAVLTGFVLGVLATASLPATPGVPQHSAMPAGAAGARPADKIHSSHDTGPRSHPGRSRPVPTS